MDVKDYKIGMKVRFIGKTQHEKFPEFYPEVGTVGEIVEFSDEQFLVKWPEGTVGSYQYRSYQRNSCIWYEASSMIELFIPSMKEGITDKENYTIWEMLKPKMAKNQFIHNGEYISEEVKKMVELAYTCGYRRAKKGKPFMYAKKNNKGENQ